MTQPIVNNGPTRRFARLLADQGQNMTLPISAAIAIILMLAACGGGGRIGNPNALIQQQSAEAEARNAAEEPRKAEEARNAAEEARKAAEARNAAEEARADRSLPFAPRFNTASFVYLGQDRLVEGLAKQDDYRGVFVRSDWVRDGEPGARVSAYLDALMTDSGGASSVRDDGNKWGLATFTGRPVLRIAENTSAEHERLTLEAVARVNRALPWDRRILIGDPAPTTGLDPDETESIPDGQIHVDFAALPGSTLGYAIRERDWDWDVDAERWVTVGARAARVAIDHPELDKYAAAWSVRVETAIRDTLTHEILHALGLDGHVPKFHFPDSTMNALSEGPPHLDLPTIDADSLWAAYTRFEPGTESFENLGPWSEYSFHIRGDMRYVGAFGVGFRNGLASPWAFGPIPDTDLADNRALSGSATWNGALLGFTPEAHTVAAAARIGVNLASLAGRADFTGLESFGVRASPGVPGTGRQWLDGDLGYTIAVQGNTFQETGGDAGTLSGHFTGRGHEGTVGTLERRDLSAAFGAKTPVTEESGFGSGDRCPNSTSGAKSSASLIHRRMLSVR